MTSEQAAQLNKIYEYVSGGVINGSKLTITVNRIHHDGSGYGDHQEVVTTVYLDNDLLLSKSMRTSSAYNQSETYYYPE